MRICLAAIILLTFTAGCATAKKTPVKEVQITLTPQELASAFEYRENEQSKKISLQLEELKKQFEGIQEKITKLRNQISKQIKDCLCPSDMK